MSKIEYQDLRTRALSAWEVKREPQKQEFSQTFDVPLERIEVQGNGVICVDGLMFRKNEPSKTYKLVVKCAKCGRLHNYYSFDFSDLAGMGRALENLGEGPFCCGIECQESDV